MSIECIRCKKDGRLRAHRYIEVYYTEVAENVRKWIKNVVYHDFLECMSCGLSVPIESVEVTEL